MFVFVEWAPMCIGFNEVIILLFLWLCFVIIFIDLNIFCTITKRIRLYIWRKSLQNEWINKYINKSAIIFGVGAINFAFVFSVHTWACACPLTTEWLCVDVRNIPVLTGSVDASFHVVFTVVVCKRLAWFEKKRKKWFITLIFFPLKNYKTIYFITKLVHECVDRWIEFIDKWISFIIILAYLLVWMLIVQMNWTTVRLRLQALAEPKTVVIWISLHFHRR